MKIQVSLLKHVLTKIVCPKPTLWRGGWPFLENRTPFSRTACAAITNVIVANGDFLRLERFDATNWEGRTWRP